MITTEAFLGENGWASAAQIPLQGDASARRYIRLCSGENRAILMVDPKDDTERFASMAEHLNSIGLSAPDVFARAPGVMLLEDFGDNLVAKRVAEEPGREIEFYRCATEVLCHLETAPLPEGLSIATAESLAEMIDPFFEFYLPAFEQVADAQDEVKTNLAELLSAYLPNNQTLVLRDHHAENMIWLPEREGVRRIGLLDFQDALIGPPIYDLVSMLQDARRDVSEACVTKILAYYSDRSGRDHRSLMPAYHLLGLQRNLRILGIFVRLAIDRKKTAYLDLLPRVWAHVRTNLKAPVAEPIRHILQHTLPEPTAERLQRIKTRCQTQ